MLKLRYFDQKFCYNKGMAEKYRLVWYPLRQNVKIFHRDSRLN